MGSKFGNRAGSIDILVRELYGLTISAERFRIDFLDYLRTFGFFPCCFDRDVWMRLRDEQDGYDFICAHLDDFKFVAKDPGMWVDCIAGIFLAKEQDLRSYYLGNDYTYHDTEDMWMHNFLTYTKESIAPVERLYDCLSNIQLQCL